MRHSNRIGFVVCLERSYLDLQNRPHMVQYSTSYNDILKNAFYEPEEPIFLGKKYIKFL